MGAYEELKEQRDFLMANTWVPGSPKNPEEGCLVLRFRGNGANQERLSRSAKRCLERVLYSRPPVVTHLMMWNDCICSGPGEAIEVLEEAMQLAKERGWTDETLDD